MVLALSYCPLRWYPPAELEPPAPPLGYNPRAEGVPACRAGRLPALSRSPERWAATPPEHIRASEVVAAQARALSRIAGCVSSARQAKAGLRSLVPGRVPRVSAWSSRGERDGIDPRR